MNRREFVAAGTTAVAAAGCLGSGDVRTGPVLVAVELENHRRDRGYEFSVTVQEDAGVAFERTRRLGPAGSGEDALVFERPVADPGDYSVRVEAGGDVQTVETGRVVADGHACLSLAFYLGARELHVEWRSYQECDSSTAGTGSGTGDP